MNVQYSGGSRSFTKEMRALKMSSTVTSYWKLTTTNWEISLKLVLLQLNHKLLKNSGSTILWSFCIWSKLERWKSLISGALWADKNFLKSCFKVSFSLILYNNNEPFLKSDCDVWWKVNYIWQLTKTSSVVGLRRSLKALLKAKFAPKKKKSHCHYLVVCCQADLLQLSESQWNHYIWELCSANQWGVPKPLKPCSQQRSTERA